MRSIAPLVLGMVLAACGGGSRGEVDRYAAPSPLGFRLTSIHAPGGEPLALDGMLEFRFTEAVDEASISGDAIAIEAPDGRRARGTFVRGRPMADPTTGMTVVVDPGPLADEAIDRAERRGDPDLIPDEVRYDLGAKSWIQGHRRVLFDRSKKHVITFVPEVPVLPDLSDTAYEPATEYRVRVRVDPSPFALRSEFDRALESPSGDPRIRRFATMGLGEPGCFLQAGITGPPAVVNTSPIDGQGSVTVDGSTYLRFSRPLDPATVSPATFTLEIVSVPGRPAVPLATMLRQTRTGLVEVVLTPLLDLPGSQWFEVGVSSGVRDLAGRSLPPGIQVSFSTSYGPWAHPIHESFEDRSQEDAAITTAEWNTTVPGALAGRPGDAVTSVAQSRWYDQYHPTPRYGTPEIEVEENGGTIDVFVQGAREDVNLPGSQPVDPEADPQRLHTTDWVSTDGIDALDNYQYLRFRVILTTEADGATTGRVPIVRDILIMAHSRI